MVRYNAFFENALPTKLTALTTLLGDKDFYVGGKVSLADIAVLYLLDQLKTSTMDLSKAHDDGENQPVSEQVQKVVAGFPKLLALRERVAAVPGIADFLAGRPAGYFM